MLLSSHAGASGQGTGAIPAIAFRVVHIGQIIAGALGSDPRTLKD